MANQIILKKSSVVSKVPAVADLAYGELALNYADGKLYYKRSDNVIDAFTVASNFAPTSHTHDYLPLSGGTMTGVITTPNGTHGIIVGDDSRLADRNVANTLFVEGNQNTDRGYINFGSTTGNSLGAIAGGSLTWNNNVVLHAANYSSYVGNGSLTVTAGTDLTGGGLLGTANQSTATSVTITHADTTRSDSTSTTSPARNGSFTVVDSVTTNARGHVTSVNVKTVTLPDFEIVTFTQALTLSDSWQDTVINATDLISGTYIVQVIADDYAVSGGQYTEYYSGVMSWYSGNTNSTMSDEITLHRAGHAPTVGNIFLRVQRTSVEDPLDLKLQIAGSFTTSGASTYTFKFRRMI